MNWPNIKYFKAAEFDSPDEPGSGSKMNPDFLARLDALRASWGKPLVVTSGVRTRAHNTAVGGAPNSAHIRGRAADIRMSPQNQMEFARQAKQAGFTGVGFYPTWVHLDDMTPAEGYSRPAQWSKSSSKRDS